MAEPARKRRTVSIGDCCLPSELTMWIPIECGEAMAINIDEGLVSKGTAIWSDALDGWLPVVHVIVGVFAVF